MSIQKLRSDAWRHGDLASETPLLPTAQNRPFRLNCW